LVVALSLVASLCVVPAALAQTMNSARTHHPGDPREFAVYWAFWAPERAWYNLEMTDVPWHTNCTSIPTAWADKYPRAGPHMIDLYPGGKDAFYRDHFAGLRVNIDLVAPNVNYDGVLFYDYEFWGPFWTGHWNDASTAGLTADDFDPIDDWREHIRTSRPQLLAGLDATGQEEVFRQTWLAQTREFFERCYHEMKRLRPRSRVGFYNFPSQNYWGWRNPERAAQLRYAYTTEMAWFWPMVDVIMSNTYVFYQSVDAQRAPAGYFDTRADFESYVRSNVGMAMSVAGGKPVLNFIGWQYHPAYVPAPLGPLNAWNLRRSFEISRELGCSGVVVFGWIQNQQQYNAAAPFFRDTLNPFLRQFMQLPSLAPQLNPAPLTPPTAPGTGPDGTGVGGGSSPPPSGPAGGGVNPNAPNAPSVPNAPADPVTPEAPTSPTGPVGPVGPVAPGGSGGSGFSPVPPPPAGVTPGPAAGGGFGPQVPGLGSMIDGAPVPVIPTGGGVAGTGGKVGKGKAGRVVVAAAPVGVGSVTNAGNGRGVAVVLSATGAGGLPGAADGAVAGGGVVQENATFTAGNLMTALSRARGTLVEAGANGPRDLAGSALARSAGIGLGAARTAAGRDQVGRERAGRERAAASAAARPGAGKVEAGKIEPARAVPSAAEPMITSVPTEP